MWRVNDVYNLRVHAPFYLPGHSRISNRELLQTDHVLICKLQIPNIKIRDRTWQDITFSSLYWYQMFAALWLIAVFVFWTLIWCSYRLYQCIKAVHPLFFIKICKFHDLSSSGTERVTADVSFAKGLVHISAYKIKNHRWNCYLKCIYI